MLLRSFTSSSSKVGAMTLQIKALHLVLWSLMSLLCISAVISHKWSTVTCHKAGVGYFSSCCSSVSYVVILLPGCLVRNLSHSWVVSCFQWTKEASVQWLYSVCYVWWEANYNYPTVTCLLHNGKRLVTDMAIYQQNHFTLLCYRDVASTKGTSTSSQVTSTSTSTSTWNYLSSTTQVPTVAKAHYS